MMGFGRAKVHVANFIQIGPVVILNCGKNAQTLGPKYVQIIPVMRTGLFLTCMHSSNEAMKGTVRYIHVK